MLNQQCKHPLFLTEEEKDLRDICAPPGICFLAAPLYISNSFYELISWLVLAKLVSGECHRTQQMASQHWFREWLGDIRQQAITWANVDRVWRRHMASPGPNEFLTHWGRNNVDHILQPTFSNAFPSMKITVKPVCNDHLYNEIYYLCNMF